MYWCLIVGGNRIDCKLQEMHTSSGSPGDRVLARRSAAFMINMEKEIVGDHSILLDRSLNMTVAGFRTS